MSSDVTKSNRRILKTVAAILGVALVAVLVWALGRDANESALLPEVGEVVLWLGSIALGIGFLATVAWLWKRDRRV